MVAMTTLWVGCSHYVSTLRNDKYEEKCENFYNPRNYNFLFTNRHKLLFKDVFFVFFYDLI